MNRYTRTGIVAGIAIGILAALHFLAFGPLASDWNRVNSELEQNKQNWNVISAGGSVPPNKKGQLIFTKRKDNIRNLNALNQVYERYQLEDKPTVASATAFLEMINVYQELERSAGNRVSVLKSMGVNSAITEGKFNNGYLADDEHRRQFPARDFINPERGTIEMWISPRWPEKAKRPNPEPEYNFLTVTREIAADTNQPRLPAIRLYMRQDTIVYEVQEAQGANRLTREKAIPARDWPAGSWHFVAVTWDQQKNRISLWVDGAEARAVSGAASVASSLPMTGMPGGITPDMMNFYMTRMGGGVPPVRSAPVSPVSPITSTVPETAFPSLTYLDSVYLGSADNGIGGAHAVIDDVRISRIVRESPTGGNNELVADADTLYLNHMENEYLDPVYLSKVIPQMEGLVRLIKSNTTGEETKKRLKQQLERFKAIFGIDKETLLRVGNPVDIFFLEFSALDYVVRNTDLDLGEAFRIFDIDVASRIGAWSVILNFKDIGYELCNLCLDSNVERIYRLAFIAESNVIDEQGLAEYFEKQISDLELKYPYFAGGGGMGGLSANYMMMMMMMRGMGGMGGVPGTTGQPGAAMPGMTPGSTSGMMDPMTVKRDQDNYNRYIKARERGEIPADIRDAYTTLKKQEGMLFYAKRILSIGLIGSLDSIAGILQSLEYGSLNPGQEERQWNRLTTVSNLVITSEDDKNVDANITLSVHSLERPVISPVELDKMMKQQQLEATPEPAAPPPQAAQISPGTAKPEGSAG